ncbi:MAG TPA: hypothetical protein VFD82_23905 [Planctomycetota bacterium]|nr:hypothetical protein [Planctomycetota bacterium]
MNGGTANGGAPAGLRLWLALAVPVLFTVWLAWPVHDGGLLSDDLALMTYLVLPGGGAEAVNWSQVAADFTGPWAFGNLNYYRPLVSLTLAVELWLGGGAEWVFHVSCIAMFALAVGSCGALFAQLAGPLAGAAGGLLLAAHPAGHEPLCWICTRADLMVVGAGAVACCLFVAHLRSGRLAPAVGAVFASALALLCKETAVMLAVWFLALDLAVRGRGVPLAARARLHLAFAVLWLGYLAWRWHMFGVVFGRALGASPMELGPWLTLQAAKLRACVAPARAGLAPTTPFTVGLLVAGTLLPGLCWRRTRPLVGLGVAGAAAGMLPGHTVTVDGDWFGIRTLLWPFVGVAFAVAAVVGAALPRWCRAAALALLAVAVADLARGTRAYHDAYRFGWRCMQTLRTQIDEVGRSGSVAQPIALLTFPRPPGVPFLFDFTSFPLAERPVASADHPFVALGGTLFDEGGRSLLARDPAPTRALWQHGARICHAVKGRDDGSVFVVPGPAETPPVVLVAQGDGRFTMSGGPVSPLAIAGLRVRAEAAFERGELEWLAPDGARLGGVALGRAVADANGWSAAVDLRDSIEFLHEGVHFGGLRTFVVRLLAGGAPVAARALEVLPPTAGAPLDRTLRGARLGYAELADRLPWTSLPADAEPDSASVVVLGGWRPLRLDRVQGRISRLPPIDVLLRELRRWIHVDRFYYYLECRRPSGVWRSAVDWFELDVEAP